MSPFQVLPELGETNSQPTATNTATTQRSVTTSYGMLNLSSNVNRARRYSRLIASSFQQLKNNFPPKHQIGLIASISQQRTYTFTQNANRPNCFSLLTVKVYLLPSIKIQSVNAGVLFYLIVLPIPSVIFALFLSPCPSSDATQTRGHQSSSPRPSPLRFVPSFLFFLEKIPAFFSSLIDANRIAPLVTLNRLLSFPQAPIGHGVTLAERKSLANTLTDT